MQTLQDRIGSRRLLYIKAFDIEELLKGLKKDGKSESYVSSARGMLFQIFNKAEANDLILKNPVRFAEKMRADKGPPKRKEAFHADEVRKVMAELPYDRMSCSIRLMLGTGMRTQEILGLEPKHNEEHGSVICIRQAVTQIKGTVTIGPPKSRGSYRDKFKEALESVGGVRVLTPHCCRHTYLSQMQALGVDLPTIQSIVGHADLDMMQHYLHVQDNVRQEAVERFSEAFGS